MAVRKHPSQREDKKATLYNRTLLVHPSPQEINLNDIKISILKSLFRAKYDLFKTS